MLKNIFFSGNFFLWHCSLVGHVRSRLSCLQSKFVLTFLLVGLAILHDFMIVIKRYIRILTDIKFQTAFVSGVNGRCYLAVYFENKWTLCLTFVCSKYIGHWYETYCSLCGHFNLNVIVSGLYRLITYAVCLLPMDTRRCVSVSDASERCRDMVLTCWWRWYCVMCLLG